MPCTCHGHKPLAPVQFKRATVNGSDSNECHVEGGHGVLYGGFTMGPTTVFLCDPCPWGLPVILTVAQLFLAPALAACLLEKARF